MAAPWEKYQAQSQANPQPREDGPWLKYSNGNAQNDPPREKAVGEDSSLVSFGAGLGKGVGTVALNAQRYLGKGINAVADLISPPERNLTSVITGQDNSGTAAGRWLVKDAEQGLQNLKSEVAPYKAASPIATGAGELGGEIAATLPVGGALGQVAKLGARALPAASPVLTPLAESLASSGFRTGATQGGLQNLATRVVGGAATGGASGALVDPESAGASALIGGALPPVLKGVGAGARYAGNVAGSLVKPFTASGQEEIANRILRKFAEGGPTEINAAELVPGSLPTLAAATANPGIATLERAARDVRPNSFIERAIANNEARAAVLQNMAGTQAQKTALKEKLEQESARLYGEAFKEQQPVTEELVRLASRPSMRRAESRAQGLASELSIPFSSTLEQMRPKSIYVGERTATPSMYIKPGESVNIPIERPVSVSSVLQENAPRNLGAGMTENVAPTEVKYSTGPVSDTAHVIGPDVSATLENKVPLSGYTEIPPVDSIPVRDAHTLKMAMDALMADPTLGIKGREASAINATRNRLLDMLPDAYQKARQSHIELNRPINQMDIASTILDKATNKVTGNITPNSFVRALTDDTAKEATGLKNATLKSMLSNEQYAALQSIKDDLIRESNQGLGKSAGSNTFQNLATNNILESAGGKLLSSAADRTGISGIVGQVGKLAYGNSNEAIRDRLINLLLSPQNAVLKEPERVQASNKLMELLRNQGGQAVTRAAPILGAQ